MATNSHIEWTDATWNPVTGCTKISPGCKHCYAERLANRLQAMGQANYRNGFEVTLQPQMLELPLKWKSPKRIFVNSAQEKLLDSATEIRLDPGKFEAAFMARELVQCTLPHANPGNVPVWTRRNGNFTLGIVPGVNIETGKSYGYPYGTIPRLLLFWITTEAVRTKGRRLELGNSLACFMRDLGLDPNTGGGKRGDARRLQEQMRRLFKSTMSFQRTMEEDHRHGMRWLDMQVAPKCELWWDPKHPDQGALWGSYIVLGEDFFEAIVAFPVPVDMRVLRALKRSPLALDLYAWVTWRVFRTQKPTVIPWNGLMAQVGSEYGDAKNFKRKAKTALGKIRALYPGLKLEWRFGGFTLYPSPTSVPALPAASTPQKVPPR